MKLRKIAAAVPLPAFLLTVAVLIVAFRDGVRQSVVAPLYALFQLVYAILSRTPESLLLLVPAVIAGIAFLVVLVRALPISDGMEKETDAGRPASGYQLWLGLLGGHGPKIDPGQLFYSELRDLVFRIIVYQEGLTPRDIRERLECGQLDLPPEVLAFLEAEERGRHTGRLKRSRFWGWILPRQAARRAGRESAAEREVRAVVEFIEGRLDLSHG